MKKTQKKSKAQNSNNANAVVLCGFCKKPIRIDDFGGMQKDIGLFHGTCLIKNEAEKQKP